MHVIQTWLRSMSKWTFLSNELLHVEGGRRTASHPRSIFLMMMKLSFIELMTTWINPSSHKFIFNYSVLSSMNRVIREYFYISICESKCVCVCVFVCLSSNWWQSVSANNLDMNSFDCMEYLSLININVHARAQMSFSSSSRFALFFSLIV